MESTLTPGRPGRKPKPYLCSDGKTAIVGLRYRQHDRRWLITATGQTFAAPTEAAAIAHFRAWQDQRTGATVDLPVATVPATFSTDKLFAVLEKAKAPATAALIFKAGQPTQVRRKVAADEFWGAVREALLGDPALAAEKTGIPELARLADLPKPKPAPTVKALIDSYSKHADALPSVKRKTARIWNAFCHAIGATDTKGITSELAIAWADGLKTKAWAPVTLANHLKVPKTVLGHALRRGIDAPAVRQALDALAVLQPPRGAATTTDPHPMAPADFHKLLAAAKPLEQAALLTMLNLCMYHSEALALRWTDLGLEAGTFSARRGKTSIARIGVLWPATISALKALPRRGDYIFVSPHGRPYHPDSFRKLFEDLRIRAGVAKSVKCADIRDGAYTTAVESGAEIAVCRALAGHSCGMADHYVMRRPQMVAPACAAIAKAYGVEKLTTTATAA